MAERTSESDPAPITGPASDDHWADAPGCETMAAPAVLPAKRAAAASRADSGLRLDGSTATRPEAEEGGGLHVEKYGASVVRLDPVEPPPSRASRRMAVNFQPRPAGAGRSGRHEEFSEWGRTGRQSVLWLVGAGTAVAAMVVGAVTLLPSINQSNAGRPGPLELVVSTEDQIEGSEALAAMYGKQEEAQRLFAAYATATSVEQRLRLLRDAAAIEPLVRAAVDFPRVSAGWHPSADETWNVSESGGRIFGLLDGNLPDHTPFSAYFVKVWGELLIDWKATTGHGTASFAELESGQGNPAEIRGFISAGDYYHSLLPEDRFRCYRFASPSGGQVIWCYVERGGDIESALDQVLGTGRIIEASSRPEKVTLRLERPPDGCMPNQWLIGEMLHKDWLSP